jgi:reactive intermediate/imine deaminase
MRTVLRLTTALTALALASAPLAAQGRTVINPNPNGRGNATLSPAIKVGNMIFASGQLGGRDSTIEGQTTASLTTIKGIMEAAGSNMEHVVKCTVFLVDVADFQKMNAEYVKFWPKDPPARSTVVVAKLVNATAKIEIECIGVMP